MKPLIIIHGWSDNASSFLPLADAIKSKSDRTVERIWLGDYVSLDDDVEMSDIVRGLSRAWKARKLPQTPKSTDVIVHSTGGLVIRDWIETCYITKGKKPPVNNLVMLAPANFGSPLAHKGRAFYGRAFKGFNSTKRFETGTQILKALEMASPYSWDLAFRDRFSKNAFSKTGVRATVIVGNTGYSGISSIANEDGSDGTVYAATANMNCEYLRLNFPSLPAKPSIHKQIHSRGDTAFLLADKHNHSTVALKDDEHPENNLLLANILKALTIGNSTDFDKWVKNCASKTRAILKSYESKRDAYKHGYQNTVFRVIDDQGFPVDDYVIEFYKDAQKGVADRFAELFNKKSVSKVHAYKDNASYRSFMIDCTELYKVIDKDNECLRISLSAMPDINDEKTMVGYRTFEDDDMHYLELTPRQVKQFFVPNRTLLVDIVLTREQKDAVFTINKRSKM